MQTRNLVECATPISAPGNLAIAEGEALLVEDAAPNNLPAALLSTAASFPGKGILFLNRDCRETFVSYPELLANARRVLGGLLAQGLAPGSKVILQLDTLEAHYTSFWGCLLGGIVPVTIAIAPTYKERNGVVNKLHNTWMLLDRPPIITTSRLVESLSGLESLVPMPDLKLIPVEQLLECPPSDSPHEPKPGDVAFIQLSSGSTGIPKCIQETHEAVIAHIHSSKAFNGYTSDDVTLNWLPVDHVVPLLTFHIKDTYLGCKQIHTPPETILANPLLWLDLLEKHRVTHTWSPNFGFKLVADRLVHTVSKTWDLSHVKFFMNAGEQVTVPVVRDFLRAMAPFGVLEEAMQPAFGMAEVCTCMTYANNFSLAAGARRFRKASLNGPLEPAAEGESGAVDFVSLGKVTPGISIRIADSDNHVLPERVIGRLQIKGPVVTPGYYKNDQANHDAFVGNGWFNTGDLGFMERGELFLTGREKEMIIIRGAKFYCYEVEDVVNSIPGVEPTYAAACGVGDPGTGTEKLAIFFVPSGVTDELNLAQAVRKRVTARLGITPGFVVPLEKQLFPKTTSGKIQRTQLKNLLETGVFDDLLRRMEAESVTAESKTPPSALEERVAGIWREVLNLTNLSPAAHLFDIGGDSLKAMQIVSRIREQWQIELPLPLLFDGAGTVQGMARWISQNQDRAEYEPPPAILRTVRTRPAPLSCSQLRIWLAEQIDPGSSLYNICRVVSLRGPLDPYSLERALHEMVQRHEILRTIYRLEEMPVQEVLPDMPAPLPRHDLGYLPPAERHRVASNLISLEVARPFDLSSGPVLRTKLLRLAKDEHLLVLVFHQIATDAWSLDLFFRELSAIYAAFCNGRENPLPPPDVQYADYAIWQQRWFSDAALENQMDYWRQKLSVPAPAIQLGDDEASSADEDHGVQTLTLPKPLLARLRSFSASEGVTLYMTLLAAYKLLILHRSHEPDVLVGIPDSGRRRLETENLLGYFVNLLVLRTHVSSRESFRQMLAKVRQTALEAFAHADIPFEKLVKRVPAGAAGYGRLFQVWCGPIDSLGSFTMGNLRAQAQAVFPPCAQFDLSCFISERPDEVTCYFEHRQDAISSGEVKQLIHRFEWLLNTIVERPHASVDDLLQRIHSAE